jgi:hypothetical protein
MIVAFVSELHPPGLNGGYVEFSLFNWNHAVCSLTFPLSFSEACVSLYVKPFGIFKLF